MAKRTDKYKKSKLKIFIYILLFIILFVGIILLWARFISTSGLAVKEVKIVNEKLPSSFHGLKVIHFSDVHYRRTVNKKYLDKIIDKINLIKPDLVLFTGDLIDKDTDITDEVITELSSSLSKIDVKYGKYAIKGNHDYSYDSFIEIMENSNFKILENSYDLIYTSAGEYIYLGGLSSSIKTEINYESALEFFKQGEENKNIYSIVLSHEPDNVTELLQNNSIDLVLSGHSHGGQIRLPYIGGLMKIKGAEKYIDEYYKIDNTELYVSYGIGTSTYSFRFFNKPSINFYRIYNN